MSNTSLNFLQFWWSSGTDVGCSIQSVTFILNFWMSSFTRSDVYFGPLSSQKTKRRPRPSFATGCLRFSFKVFTYPSLFVIPSIFMRFPVPDPAHSIIPPPPCFTIGLYTQKWAQVSCHLTKGHDYRMHNFNRQTLSLLLRLGLKLSFLATLNPPLHYNRSLVH